MALRRVISWVTTISLLATTLSSAAPPAEHQFGDRLGGSYRNEDNLKASSSDLSQTFVQLSNNPKVSILQAPLTSSFMPNDKETIESLLKLQNSKIIPAISTRPVQYAPLVQSSISSSVSSFPSNKVQNRNDQKSNKVIPSIFPASTPLFGKTWPKTPAPAIQINLNQKKIASSSLVDLKTGENVVEIPVKFTSSSVNPVIIGNKKNIITGSTQNIQFLNLGTASEAKKRLQLLNSGQSSRSLTSVKDVSVTSNLKNNSHKKFEQNQIPTTIQETSEGNLQLKQIATKQTRSKTNREMSEMQKRLTIGEYLLNLNGKNGIVVLPMSDLFNRRNTATAQHVEDKPKNLISQLAHFAVAEGLVDDLKQESSTNTDVRNDGLNQIVGLSLGSTTSMRKNNDQDIKIKPIQTSRLLSILGALPSADLPQDVSGNIFERSNIEVRQVEEITTTTTENPELFRKTFADFFFVKGQWIGTLIGGLMDMGQVFSDAIRDLARGTSSVSSKS